MSESHVKSLLDYAEYFMSRVKHHVDNNKSFTDAIMESGFDTGVEYTGDLVKDFIDDIKKAFLEAIEGPKD